MILKVFFTSVVNTATEDTEGIIVNMIIYSEIGWVI